MSTKYKHLSGILKGQKGPYHHKKVPPFTPFLNKRWVNGGAYPLENAANSSAGFYFFFSILYEVCNICLKKF